MTLEKVDDKIITNCKKFKIIMDCSSEFDLIVIYETLTDVQGMLFFNNTGHLNEFPFMKVDGKTLQINDLTHIKYVWLVCFDKESFKNGTPRQFIDNSIKLSIITDDDTYINHLDSKNKYGNTALLLTIDNSKDNTIFINNSDVKTLTNIPLSDVYVHLFTMVKK